MIFMTKSTLSMNSCKKVFKHPINLEYLLMQNEFLKVLIVTSPSEQQKRDDFRYLKLP